VDRQKRVRYFETSSPGSMHDAKVWRLSKLRQDLEAQHREGTFQHLIGDEGNCDAVVLSDRFSDIRPVGWMGR